METEILRITKRKLNDGQHNIVRARFSTEEVFLTSVNHDLEVGNNLTERYIDENNKNKGVVTDVFGLIEKFTVGTIFDEKKLIDAKGYVLPTIYIGCMSGAKLVYSPRATPQKKFRNSIEIDMFALIESENGNPSGTFPKEIDGLCGPVYDDDKLPLPPVDPPRQFYTVSPGLDNSVMVTTIDSLNVGILILVVLVVVVVLLGFLFLIYKKVNTNNKNYNKEKQEKKGRSKSILETPQLLKPTASDVTPLLDVSEFPDEDSSLSSSSSSVQSALGEQESKDQGHDLDVVT